MKSIFNLDTHMSTPAIVKLLIVTALSQIFQAQAEPVPWSSYEDLIPFDRRSVVSRF